jgi:hypothetical protein
MARPHKIDPESTAAICRAILDGASLQAAASHGRIHEATLHRYLARGKAALERADGDLERVDFVDRPFSEFCESVEAARKEWELGQLAIIHQAARGETTTTTVRDKNGEITSTVTVEKRGLRPDWRAALTLLERRNPREYGKTLRNEISGPDGGKIDMTIDELVARGEAAADELARRRKRRLG